MKRISIKGKEYPCRITMGALLRFKRETGKDASELGETDVADLITLLWCCVASASKADGVEFGLGLMDFADRIEPTTFTGFYASMSEEAQASGDTEKKTV